MKEINDIDDLRNLLRQEWLLDGSNIEKKFQNLASILLHNVVILKGNKKYKLYRYRVLFLLFYPSRHYNLPSQQQGWRMVLSFKWCGSIFRKSY